MTQFSHGLGFSAPNATYNVGADISLTPKIVSTTRYGYFFENYHDFGWPTTAPNIVWSTNGVGASRQCGQPPAGQPAAACRHNHYALHGSYTLFNANKHYQFNQDVAFFKGGWWGTHNFKFGYQLNHLST